MIKNKRIPLLIIFLIFIGLSLFKTCKVLNSRYLTRDESCTFWTESAIQYHYAKAVAMGENIPVVDRKAEYPGGYPAGRYHPVLMEGVAGYLYRVLPLNDIPFHVFLIILMSFYSSLSVIAVYLISSEIWDSKWTGIFSALLYSFTFSASMTVLNIAYEFQDFTLFLMFFHIFFLLRAERTENNYSLLSNTFLSGAFLFAALASWHLTQFYYAVLLVYFFLRLIIDENYDFRILYILTGFVILSGLTLPLLDPPVFFTSFPMLFNYCLLIITPFRLKNRWASAGILLLSFLSLLFIKSLFMDYNSGFNMMLKRGIFPLILAKIRWFGNRPPGGANLNWETLTLWVHPYNNPALEWTVKSFGVLLPSSLFAGFLLVKKTIQNKNLNQYLLIIFFFSVFLISYLFFERMDVFLILFMAVLAGLFIHRYSNIWGWIILLLMIPNLIIVAKHKPNPPGPQRNYLLQVLRTIKSKTSPDSPVLSHFAYSPTILAWTGRPVIFHPKFESPSIVDKVKDFEHLLFESEKNFYDYCKKYGVEYFLLSSDLLLSRNYTTIRYRTQNLRMEKECVLFKMHFSPEKLKYFYLIYSNPQYRIFRIHYPGEKIPEEEFEYFRAFDVNNFDLRKLGIH